MFRVLVGVRGDSSDQKQLGKHPVLEIRSSPRFGGDFLEFLIPVVEHLRSASLFRR